MIRTVSSRLGRLDVDRLEPALQRTILLDMLAVLIERRGADALDFATRQRRLQHVGGIDRSFRGTGSHQRVQFVDEDDDVAGLDDLLHHHLETFLELAAIFRAGNQRTEVQRDDAA